MVLWYMYDGVKPPCFSVVSCCAKASYLWIGQVQTCCRFVRGWIAYDPVGNTTDDCAPASELGEKKRRSPRA